MVNLHTGYSRRLVTYIRLPNQNFRNELGMPGEAYDFNIASDDRKFTWRASNVNTSFQLIKYLVANVLRPFTTDVSKNLAP